MLKISVSTDILVDIFIWISIYHRFIEILCKGVKMTFDQVKYLKSTDISKYSC